MLALDEQLQGPDELALHERDGRVIPDHPPAVLDPILCLGDGFFFRASFLYTLTAFIEVVPRSQPKSIMCGSFS